MTATSEPAGVLNGHPGVRRAEVVSVVHNGREVAVAVVEPSEYLSGPVLRDVLRSQLGDDGAPAGVLIVDSLAETGAEQVRSAIADGRCTLFESPGDDVERRVAEIWSREMDLRSVGVHDDFLELGGDSLAALGIIAAVEAEFDRSLDVFEFMTAASVRRLADLLR
jgi:acyl carrier protein